MYVLIPTNQLESLSSGRFAVPLPHLSRSLHDPIFFRPKVKDSVHVGLPIKAHICGLDIAIVAPSISNNDARSSRNCVKLFSEIYYFVGRSASSKGYSNGTNLRRLSLQALPFCQQHSRISSAIVFKKSKQAIRLMAALRFLVIGTLLSQMIIGSPQTSL